MWRGVNTLYYLRVRYRGSNNAVSAWSEVVVVRTRSSFAPFQEYAQITIPDQNGNLLSLVSVISADGSRLLVGAPGSVVDGKNRAGAAYVFIQSKGTWVLESKLVPLILRDNGYFGAIVKIDSTGTRAAISSVNTGDIYYASPEVYVFTRTGSVWAQEAKLLPVLTENGGITLGFGHCLSVSSDCSRIVAGCRYDAQSNNGSGSCYVYTRTGTSWSTGVRLLSPDLQNNQQFGVDVAISANGNRLVVGSYIADAFKGAAYILEYNTTTGQWNHSAKLQGLSSVSNSVDTLLSTQQAATVAISQDGGRVATSAWLGTTSDGVIAAGVTYVFVKNTVTGVWEQEAEILPPDRVSFESTIDRYFLPEQYNPFFSKNTDRLLISAFGRPDLSYPGGLYVYKRTGTAWTQETKIMPFDLTGDMRFGSIPSITDDSSLISVISNYKIHIYG